MRLESNRAVTCQEFIRLADLASYPVSAEALRRQRLPGAAIPARHEAGLRADQRRDRQTVRCRQVRGVAQTLDRRTDDRLAQPVPPPGQGLGVSEPKRSCLLALGIHPADGPKALSGQQMISDGLLA